MYRGVRRNELIYLDELTYSKVCYITLQVITGNTLAADGAIAGARDYDGEDRDGKSDYELPARRLGHWGIGVEWRVSDYLLLKHRAARQNYIDKNYVDKNYIDKGEVGPSARRRMQMANHQTHDYQVQVVWTGNTGQGTANYRAYGRSHEITAVGKPAILGSADAAFRGNTSQYNPEELLVASLSACHMLWLQTP